MKNILLIILLLCNFTLISSASASIALCVQNPNKTLDLIQESYLTQINPSNSLQYVYDNRPNSGNTYELCINENGVQGDCVGLSGSQYEAYNISIINNRIQHQGLDYIPCK